MMGSLRDLARKERTSTFRLDSEALKAAFEKSFDKPHNTVWLTSSGSGVYKPVSTGQNDYIKILDMKIWEVKR
jgi:hypothetical protein